MVEAGIGDQREKKCFSNLIQKLVRSDCGCVTSNQLTRSNRSQPILLSPFGSSNSDHNVQIILHLICQFFSTNSVLFNL